MFPCNCPERSRLVKRLCIPAGIHTTSELAVGNNRPGAPVTEFAKSGGLSATRVEPWNTLYTMYPTPDLFQGVGYFYCLNPLSENGGN